MIVSHKHEFVFLKTRRTAGSSIEAALAPHLGPEDAITGSERDGTIRQNVPDGLTGHVGWRKVMSLFPNVGCYTWFCVERNSYAKALSDWLWHRDVLKDTALPLAQYIRDRRPSDWERYTDLHGPVCSVLQYESVVAPPAALTNKGITVELPHIKSQNRGPCVDYYGPDERAAVEKVFAHEIAHFGYEMPAPGERG